MAKKKPATDPNVIAHEILQALTGEPAGATSVEKASETPISLEGKYTKKPQKNPAAVALGRLGGLKGGKARAAKLTTKQRKAIAKQAARARWKRHPK